MPEVKDIHVDSVLSNVSKKYSSEQLIWRDIAPIVLVKNRSDFYYVYSRPEQFRLPDDSMGPKSEASETDFTVTTDNYSVVDHGLSEFVSRAEEENADSPLSPRADAVEFITNLLMLAQEKRVADLVFNAAAYPAGNKVTLSGTSQWNDKTNSDPLSDILAGLDAAFVRPNTIVMGRLVFTKLRQHPKMVDAVRSWANVDGGMVSLSDIAKFFDVEQVLVGRAKYNSAKEGQGESMSDIWGKHCGLLHVNQKSSVRSVTFARTFCEMPLTTQVIPEPKRGVKGGNLIKVTWNSNEKIIASDLGYFIENAIV